MFHKTQEIPWPAQRFLSNGCSVQLVVYNTATETEVRTGATKRGNNEESRPKPWTLPQTAVFLQFICLRIGAAIHFTLGDWGKLRSHIMHASFSCENECNRWQHR